MRHNGYPEKLLSSFFVRILQNPYYLKDSKDFVEFVQRKLELEVNSLNSLLIQ